MFPAALAAAAPSSVATKFASLCARRPSLLVATDQSKAVHTFCEVLREFDYPVNVVFEIGDVLAHILGAPSRHHLLVTRSEDGLRPPVVPATELVASLREIGYPGCIHLRTSFVAPTELGCYQKAAVGYVLTHRVGGNLLEEVEALTAAAPAGAACLSILQVDAPVLLPL